MKDVLIINGIEVPVMLSDSPVYTYKRNTGLPVSEWAPFFGSSRHGREMNPSFTYAEYAVEKYLNGHGDWLVHHDYGVDNTDSHFVSGFQFLRIGKKYITKTPKKKVCNATERFKLEVNQLSGRVM